METIWSPMYQFMNAPIAEGGMTWGMLIGILGIIYVIAIYGGSK